MLGTGFPQADAENDFLRVYRVGDLHFVADGHHRVSIAAATRQRLIDAYVTEVLTTRAAGR